MVLFARKIERTSTAFVVLLPYSAAQSCAALTLHLSDAAVHWEGSEAVPHSRQISNIELNLRLVAPERRSPYKALLHTSPHDLAGCEMFGCIHVPDFPVQAALCQES